LEHQTIKAHFAPPKQKKSTDKGKKINKKEEKERKRDCSSTLQLLAVALWLALMHCC